MPPLTSNEVDAYAKAFRTSRTIVIAGVRWDGCVVERNVATGVYGRAVGPQAPWTAATGAELRNAAPLLVRLLNAQVVDEHFWFLDSIHAAAEAAQRHPIRDELEALAAVLSRAPRSTSLDEHKWLIAAPLMFALTEHVLKVRCSAYVDRQGAVLQPWSISFGGKTKAYGPVGQKGAKSQVNRLGHLLALGRSQVLSPAARAALDAIEAELASLEAVGTAQGVLDESLDRWRNELLHGEQLWTARGPVQLAVLGVLSLEW